MDPTDISIASSFRYLFDDYYLTPNNFDEFFLSNGKTRDKLRDVIDLFNKINPEKYTQLHNRAIKYFSDQGVTFGDSGHNQKKIFPFDLIPRIITHHEWEKIEAGLQQRTKAMNEFLYDIYHHQFILKDKVIPRELIESSHHYHPQLQHIAPPHGIYIHVAGIDVIRDAGGNFLILEDNLRIPSGVSYALTNRYVIQRIFPDIMANLSIRAIHDYPQRLSNMLCSLVDMDHNDTAVVLTPGPLNSAYYEHVYLAKNMGWPLVQGSDLVVEKNEVYLKRFDKKIHVRVIYRRIEDTYLDPTMFNKDSLIGTPGLMKAYRAGNVVIANALGNGIADDKAIFAYVPQMINYYLNETPLLPQVETYLCSDRLQKQYVLENAEKLVIKMVDQSGGTGVLIGPQASHQQINDYQNQIKENPRKFIAQPLVELSSCPIWNKGKMVPRRIDLRPFILSGLTSWVMPGGLSRVALVENSYIVNSCQGGGSKDTWVVD